VAEIPIRRKEGRNVWPLLLGLLVLAAVLWFVVVRHGPSTTAAVRADTAAAASGNVTRDSVGGTVKVDTAK
jgi:ABC-type transporter Mla subunit MlaD